MAELTCQFVRPDRLLFEGPVQSLVLVIILADHARRSDDIEPDVVRDTREAAFDARDALPERDSRRAYYDEKIKWCNLLLKHAQDTAVTPDA